MDLSLSETNELRDMNEKMTRDLTMKTTMRPQVQVFFCHKFSQTGNMASKNNLVLTTLAILSTLALILISTRSFQTEAIKLQPEGKEKFYWSGEQFVITCQNNNNIKNVKIRWIGPNGLDITEDRSQRVHAESTGPHGHRLVVMNATASTDDGQYKCTLGSTDDRNPREHIEFTLKLHKTTSFKETARHLVLPAGQPGTLNCRVEFDPNVLSASVSWVRDQKPIEMFNDSSYSVVEYDPNRQLSQLLVSPITKHHDGIYTCRAVAVTSQLSKISDHNIYLETNYAPSFDKDSHTVWVERSQSVASRQQLQQQANVYGGQSRAHHSAARSRHGKQQYPASSSNGFPIQANQNRRPVTSDGSDTEIETQNNSSQPAQVVRVELHCTCQANPPASIMWTSTQNSMFILAKGEPAHVLEEPRTEVEGHNTTSVLVIGYNLEADWPYRRDSYICSASNKIGKATKSFTVEQGDPPPAFNVGPNKHYNPQTSQFKFTLLGPNFDPGSKSNLNSGSAQQMAAEILPPVDSFRIRAESTSVNNGADVDGHGPKTSYWSNSRKQNEPSVQWTLSNYYQQQQHHNHQSDSLISSPQNYTVSLGKLPSGNQKLFLEAHNAVGWSPNATYLGDYYIISRANSLLANVYFQLMVNMLGCLLIINSAALPGAHIALKI